MQDMSSLLTLQINSDNADFTEQVGEIIGNACRGGEVFVLESDLGGGKTTFVRGLARGLGSEDTVTSPTFMISRVYEASMLTLHHFDFYRLDEPGVVLSELEEVLKESQNVVAIEWSGIVGGVLPENRVTVAIKKVADNEQVRILTITYPDYAAYLFEEMSIA
jgi:tRNA threonylcarbamoyladenosine biosynthesis protein TsaE